MYSEKQLDIEVGIDLGTTQSCIGYWRSDSKSVEIMHDSSGRPTQPSIIHFLKPN